MSTPHSPHPAQPAPEPAPQPWPAQHTALAERVLFHGWNGFLLANDFVRVVAVPDIGGRIMALDLRGSGSQPDHPFIWFHPDLAGKLFSAKENQGDGSLGAWKNYGGDKTWPAPQGWGSDAEWHGPPDAVLDSGRYRVEEFGERTGNGGGPELRMVSSPDARTGLQISRQVHLAPGSSRVELLIGFRNASPTPVRWSIWDVIQLNAARPVSAQEEAASHSAARGQDYDPSCVLTAPLVGSASVSDCSPAARAAAGAPASAEPFHVMFGSEDNTQWQARDGIFYAHYQWQIGKVGIRAPGGWVAFNQGSQAATFVARFAVDPSGSYPDGGSTVECWTVGGGQVGNLNYEGTGIYHMEAEVLSPLHTIAPGREVRFAVNWALCRCNGPVLHSEDGGCSVERLSATRAADNPQQVELRGRFGVFDAGTLELGWIDSHGRRLASQALGVTASPLAELVLNKLVAAPPGAVSAELWLRAPGGVHRVDCCVF